MIKQTVVIIEVYHFCQIRTKFIQHPAAQVNSICRENYWGWAVWILMQQANYWSYILHSSNTWEKMGMQWSSASALCRLQQSLWFREDGGLVQCSHWVWYPHETGKANKNVSEWDYIRVQVGKHLSDMFLFKSDLK